MSYNSKKVIKMLQDDGWKHIGTRGSHMYFKHQTKQGKVTVPKTKDIPKGTYYNILKQAGLQ